MSVLGKRLKEARIAAGISQEALGIEAGLDEMSASTRMNRYELGKRVPDFTLMEKIAKILNVPAAYFYAVSDDEARILLTFHRLNKKQKGLFLASLSGI
jgi:transcriptional regulator with XRE-family HTH domain